MRDGVAAGLIFSTARPGVALASIMLSLKRGRLPDYANMSSETSMVLFQRRGPRHGEGPQPPRRYRRGDGHLRAMYANSRKGPRRTLGSVRLPTGDSEAAAFLHLCEARLVKAGVGGIELSGAMTKIRVRLDLVTAREGNLLAHLRQQRGVPLQPGP